MTTAPPLDRVAFDPVFIIGDHRSGTTVLYQALARTGAFNVVTAYHVIKDSEVVANYLAGREPEARADLSRRFNELGLTDRGLDGVAVTPDLPEEYGFIIDKTGRPRLRPATVPALVDLCRRIRFTGADKPILLKNPWDVLEFAFVKQTFPSARFVFVHRDPLMVMNSQVAALGSMMSGRNAYLAMLSPWYDRIWRRPIGLTLMRLMSRPSIAARTAARHVAKVASYYMSHIGAMPATDYVELRYEDLCAAPDQTIGRVLDFLHLTNLTGARADDLVRPRNPQPRPEVVQAYRHIRTRLAPYCSALHYPLHD